jgi:hypothetical protein
LGHENQVGRGTETDEPIPGAAVIEFFRRDSRDASSMRFSQAGRAVSRTAVEDNYLGQVDALLTTDSPERGFEVVTGIQGWD